MRRNQPNHGQMVALIRCWLYVSTCFVGACTCVDMHVSMFACELGSFSSVIYAAVIKYPDKNLFCLQFQVQSII